MKSASSTVEEMVARQFVERLAKKRGITLPGGDIFAEVTAAKIKKAAAGKKAEPPIPAGPLGDAIRYGQRIVTDTQATVRPYVGNVLNCSNCHLDAGRTPQAAPFVGLTGLFPEYRARRGSVESLEDRINDCFLRSMNGKPLPSSSAEMTAMLAYIAWLFSGVPVGAEVQGRGFRDIHAPAPADPVRGKTLYAAKCASCHGASGEGIKSGPTAYAFPPLWGALAFNVGAERILKYLCAMPAIRWPFGLQVFWRMPNFSRLQGFTKLTCYRTSRRIRRRDLRI